MTQRTGARLRIALLFDRPGTALLYREQLREIRDRKQINVVSAMLKRQRQALQG